MSTRLLLFPNRFTQSGFMVTEKWNNFNKEMLNYKSYIQKQF